MLTSDTQFVGLVIVVIFYFPPPRVNSQGMSTKEILSQIDYIGGILSIGGMLLFMMGSEYILITKKPSVLTSCPLPSAMGRISV